MGQVEDNMSRGAVQITTSTVTHNDNFELAMRTSSAPDHLSYVKEDIKEDDADSVDGKHPVIGDDPDYQAQVYPAYQRQAGNREIDLEARLSQHKVVSFQPST